jgi:two-component system, OmpR family, sensor histidine kinase VicK
MRTPVAAIEGYLALALNDKVSKIDDKAREYLNKAHSSTQHLGQLFQDLLTSAKAEDGRLTSHPKVIEMSEFTTQLAEDLKFVAEKKGLGMELVINAKGGGEIIDTSSSLKTIQPLYFCLIDPERVREVITNVFDNAVKYTPEGRVTIGLTGNDQVVQIKISDTGPGIPEEDVPHLFQKFYRVDNSATRAIGGTGLGLFICKKIIELYNGNIWAESKLGEGSTFYINLPRLSTSRAEQLKNQADTNVVKA